MSNQYLNPLNIPMIKNNDVSFRQSLSPAMQGDGTQMIQDSANNTYVANRLKSSDTSNPIATAALTAGSWYAITQGMDKFGPKCQGNYKDTILGKLAQKGDNFATNNYFGRKIEGFLNWFDQKFTNLGAKSKIAYTLKNHSTKPEWSFAKMPWAGLKGFVTIDWQQIEDSFLKPIAGRERKLFGFIKLKPVNDFYKLKQYGWTNDQISQFERSLDGLSFEQKALALQKKEIELIGGIDPKVLRKIQACDNLQVLQRYVRNQKITKALGYKSAAQRAAIHKNMVDNVDDLMKAMSRGKQNLKISIWQGEGSWFKRLKSHLFGREVGLSEYLNKLKASTGKEAKTRIGRFLPKMLGWITEGGTCRFGGGKLVAIMQATIIGDMLYNTFTAKKGDKIKTMAERVVNDFSYFIAMTAGIVLMHKLGGFKYAGLDNAGKKHYQQLKAAADKLAKARLFSSKKEYNNAYKVVNDALGTKNIKNPITKILHYIGRLVNAGNERNATYISNAPWYKNMNFLRRMANSNIIGVPLRIWLAMMVISPFIAKAATKTVHAIVGRPEKSVLDEDEEQASEEKIQSAQIQNSNNPFNNNIQQPNTIPKDYQSDSNLIKMYKEGNPPVDSTVTNETVTNVTNNINNVNKVNSPNQGSNAELEPKRTYIPSPDGIVKQDEDMSALNSAFARADKAEAQIQNILAIK